MNDEVFCEMIGLSHWEIFACLKHFSAWQRAPIGPFVGAGVWQGDDIVSVRQNVDPTQNFKPFTWRCAAILYFERTRCHFLAFNFLEDHNDCLLCEHRL